MYFKAFTLILLTVSFCACGGGSSSDSGMLIEGTLTQGGEAAHSEESHSKTLTFKHSSGERIENVNICALGECSTTDGEGQWGFVVSESFKGGNTQFTINGHGIDTQTIVDIPENANNVFIEFSHEEDEVLASRVTSN